MSSPSKPFNKLSVGKTRERANTEDLLPDDFDVNVVPTCPVPEDDPAHYTFPRMEKSLAFAHGFMWRNISPRARLFLSLVKAEVKEAMHAETYDEIFTYAKRIMILDRLVRSMDFWRPSPRPQNVVEMEQEILKLRQIQYVARYGDYLEFLPTRIRAHASKTRFEGSDVFTERSYWTPIAAEIRHEDELLEEQYRLGDSQSPVNGRYHLAIGNACHSLGISRELVLLSVKEYGDRNSEVHRDLGDLRKAGKFHILAKILFTDREELCLTFPVAKSTEDIDALREIIQDQIDTWFVCHYPDEHQSWYPNQALLDVEEQERLRLEQQEQKQAKAEQCTRDREEKIELKAERKSRQSESGHSDRGSKRVVSGQEPDGAETSPTKRRAIAEKRQADIALETKLEDDIKALQALLAAHLKKMR
jgi:hypothetical protein